MSELIIIAGPQAAGKTTVIKGLDEQYYNISPLFPKKRKPVLFILQESRQIIVHKNALLGGIFMSETDELEVVECDLDRMDMLLTRNKNNVVYLDECNIFTIAHALSIGLRKMERYWNAYLVRLKKFRAKVIFLNIPPEISWVRRCKQYEKRLVYFPKAKHKLIMSQYKKHLWDIYPALLKVYQRIEFPKEIIDASLPEADLIQLVSRSLSRLSTVFK